MALQWRYANKTLPKYAFKGAISHYVARARHEPDEEYSYGSISPNLNLRFGGYFARNKNATFHSYEYEVLILPPDSQMELVWKSLDEAIPTPETAVYDNTRQWFVARGKTVDQRDEFGFYDPKDEMAYLANTTEIVKTTEFKVLHIEYTSEPKESFMYNVLYNLAQKSEESSGNVILAQQAIENKSLSGVQPGQSQTTFVVRYDKTQSSSWTLSGGMKIGVSVTYKTGIPMILEGNVVISPEISISGSWEKGYSTSTVAETRGTVSLGVNEKAKISVTVKEMTLTIPYTATLRTTYENGVVTEVPVSGVYKGCLMMDFHTSYEYL